MNPQPTNALEELLRTNDLGWMLDWFSPREKALEFLLRSLEEASAEARARFKNGAPQFTEAFLEREHQQNPYKVRAFLQALGATHSPQMLIMVWRILQGMRIQEVDMAYREQKSFRLRVVLNSPYEDASEVYESSDIGDAKLLRHLGTLEVDGKPVFDGFYPLRVG